jgi:tagatose-1,6-bisphosphate aldolase non-catalytic subunit AgaZ/GatZ
MNTIDNTKRRAELSSKLLEMGQALMKEGSKSDDYTITQAGTMLMLVGTLILDAEDMLIFAEICAMFSAKKILDASENINPLHKKTLARVIKEKTEMKVAPKKKATTRKPKGPKTEE